MTSNQYIDLRRLGNLIKREGLVNYKLFAIALGGISGILLILFLATAYGFNVDGETRWDLHYPFFFVTFVVLGVGFTSMAYKDLLQVNKAYGYLTLPVSNVERLISMLFLTSIVFAVFYTLYYWVFAAILNGIGSLYTSLDFITFNPFNEMVIKAVKLYIVLQSIFLLGAASFKRFPFLFTMLTLFVATVILITITGLTVRVAFAEFITNNIEVNPEKLMPEGIRRFLEEDAEKVARFIFWYLLAPFCWFITYLKLKEREV